MLIRAITTFISCWIVSAHIAAADGLPKPVGNVVLTVTGGIGVSNAEGAALFDMDMLASIGRHSFETTTVWTDGNQQFTGVELAELVDVLDASGGVIRATALNDYSVEIPLSDAIGGGAMIAYERNGAPMSIRENGPLWVVYPYDENPAFQSEVVYSRSIWQLDRMEFVTP